MADEDDPNSTAHLSTHGPDHGHFSTLEVRAASAPVELTSRNIRFPRGHYKSPPNVAGGFKMLHLAANAPGIRANLVGSDISKHAFRIGLETWDGGVMYQAAATWIEHRAGAKECHFGQMDTLDDDLSKKPQRRPLQRSFSGGSMASEAPAQPARDYARQISFPKGCYTEPPEVVCWLNRLDFDTGDGARAFNLKAWSGNVTKEGAKMHISTSRSSRLRGAAMCWIAFPRNKNHVDSGVFSTSDDAVGAGTDGVSLSRIRMTRGQVFFRKGCFVRTPTVLVALDMLEMAADADLRINVEVQSVTREGFEWTIETWDDSTLHAASASWIALGFA